ncbi:DUF4147 domain-containing protein [Halorarum halophilum]|uniref:DUF4147 domain-containing protein n=1 Tax=Halorarum halophilum TaxID=2743090 RepID=A0A7D5GJU6_9EURY|nr:DUF4147 domain-containing protein [Halobaculum halophilum]QLG27044.1 DUF4147 domain-containing protein [Halobaculum halophilum]
MIQNRDAYATTPARETALACVEAGIRAAMPDRAVERALSLSGDTLHVADATYDLSSFDRVLVVGGGKASARLTGALVDLLGDRIDDGVVLVPESDAGAAGPVTLGAGGHPTPTEEGVAATRRALDLVRDADERTLVLAPVTGGGSALFAAPAPGVSLAAVQSVTRDLLDAGAAIDEVNAVRTAVSAVKGGRLAAEAAPATVVGLLLSDVVGDDPAVVASGPTVAAESTPGEARWVLNEYGVAADEIREFLSDAEPGPVPDDLAFDRVRTVVLADATTALEAARETAVERGYDSRIVSPDVTGESSDRGREGSALALDVLACGDGPAVLLSGGETTVTVRGNGRGGPNCEYALAGAIHLAEVEDDTAAGDQVPGERVAVAAVDTDGLDGSSDAAGALVDGTTVDDPDAAHDALADNDALGYLEERGALRTGPTGTNVNDLRAWVVEGDADGGTGDGSRTGTR